MNNHKVKYILAGGYSVILHGYSRTTGDLDVWVNPQKNNYRKLINASIEFGLIIDDMTEYNFLENNNIDVFTFGRSLVSIDIYEESKRT